MNAGRAETIVSLVGLLVIVLIVLLGVSRMFRGRARRRARAGEGDFLDDAGIEEDGGPDRAPPEFDTFAEALDAYVAPLHGRYPDWERLDGAVGLPGRAAFRFERDGIRFEVNGESLFEPLLAARAWLESHPGEDPLEVFRTGRVGRLRLRAEIWPNPRDVKIQTT